MSLRNQIIYRIFFSSICILVLGGAIAIWQARQAVTKEVDASVHLAVQFITLGIADNLCFKYKICPAFGPLDKPGISRLSCKNRMGN